MRALIVILAITLAGCATTYSDKNIAGQGVSALATSADTYRISALGNAMTSKEAIQDFALLKAAETTQSAGHTHFEVLQSRDGSITSVHSGITTPAVHSLTQPGDEMTIRVFSLKSGQILPQNAYSAQDVIKTVGARVAR